MPRCIAVVRIVSNRPAPLCLVSCLSLHDASIPFFSSVSLSSYSSSSVSATAPGTWAPTPNLPLWAQPPGRNIGMVTLLGHRPHLWSARTHSLSFLLFLLSLSLSLSLSPSVIHKAKSHGERERERERRSFFPLLCPSLPFCAEKKKKSSHTGRVVATRARSTPTSQS